MKGVLRLAALAGSVAALAAGCGGGGSNEVHAATLAQAHAAVVEQLDAKHLSYRWVACIRTGRMYRGVAIVRCNVNFGDPHIVAYCTVFRGTDAVTQVDDPAIPCGPDRAGWAAPTVTS